MMLSARPSSRPGLSLLEVLAALAIFLMSFIAIGRLVTVASDRALEVQMQSQATQLAQSKLNEVIGGALPLSSQSGEIDEDPDWHWSIDATQGDVSGLWTVTVRVWREVDNHEVESTLTQMMLDPTVRGSVFDQLTVTGAGDTAPATSGSGSNATQGSQASPSQGSAASGPTPSKGKGTTPTPSKGGGMTPAPGRGNTPTPTPGKGNTPTPGKGNTPTPSPAPSKPGRSG
jgi:Tfp pilus assembly protein PilV